MGIFIISSVLLQTGISARFALMGLRRFGYSGNSLYWAVLLFSWGLCSITVSHAVAALLFPIILQADSFSGGLSSSQNYPKDCFCLWHWGTVCGSNIGLLSSARASLALELYDEYGVEKGWNAGLFLSDSSNSLLSVLIAGVVLQLLFPSRGVSIQECTQRKFHSRR